MASPSEKLAESLDILHGLQNANGAAAIRAKDMTRVHRERLLANGFLQEVIKGWYIPSRPDDKRGESTAWYASFWRFAATYLQTRFGRNWCLSPEQSLSLHGGNWTVPRQLAVRSPGGKNNVTKLPHGTSLLDLKASLPAPADREEKDGLRIYSLEAALIDCSPQYFASHATDARASLAIIRDSSGLLAKLLEGGHSTIAGRLAGAFRNGGRERIADEIVKTMSAAGYTVRETDPFNDRPALAVPAREASPYVNRIRLLWQKMRDPVIGRFPKAPGLPRNLRAYMKDVQEAYVTDAYHSLSIEGYRVTPELIERVREGAWNPEAHETDRDDRDALAARGYWQAFQKVKEAVAQIIAGADAAKLVRSVHRGWYREMFQPCVAAGLIEAGALAGYRTHFVHLQSSRHVPPRWEVVPDAMEAMLDLLEGEQEPAARIVLGHWLFGYIHPYPDGNGRMARFLMNAMLASGGYPWTVVRVEDRNPYLAA